MSDAPFMQRHLPCLLSWCQWTRPYPGEEPGEPLLAQRDNHVMHHSVNQLLVELERLDVEESQLTEAHRVGDLPVVEVTLPARVHQIRERRDQLYAVLRPPEPLAGEGDTPR